MDYQALAAYLHFVVKVAALGGERVGEERMLGHIGSVAGPGPYRRGPQRVAKVRAF